MDVILLQKVANLGNIGDRVKVKSGYGRNFLLPKGKATLVTSANVARFEAMRAELERNAHAELASAQQRAEAFKDFKLTITAKAGSEGKLFGSVGTTDIAEACTAAGTQRSAPLGRTAALDRRTHGTAPPAYGCGCLAVGDHRRRRAGLIRTRRCSPGTIVGITHGRSATFWPFASRAE
jgi:large subunit ribosomal protein L9